MKLMRAIPESQELLEILLGTPEHNEYAHDRTATLVAVSLIERGLTKAISHHFKSDPDDPRFARVFEAEGAPLRDFASKSRLALALGIITKETYGDLTLIRQIRNVFAHAEARIGFSTKEIADLCDDLNTVYDDRFLSGFAELLRTQGLASIGEQRRQFLISALLHNMRLQVYPSFEKFSSDFMSLAESPVLREILSRQQKA